MPDPSRLSTKSEPFGPCSLCGKPTIHTGFDWCDECEVNAHDYCGCCGEEIPDDGVGVNIETWCAQCKVHVGTEGPMWERTFSAIYGGDCPFQVGGTRD